MENINPYVFISKKMSVKIINDKPRISLKSNPPQRVTKKIFSDFLNPILIKTNPIMKLIKAIIAPNRMDL